MAGVNKVILIGNLGKDPEVRHLENGRAVAIFPLATNESYKNKEGERVTTTEWHNIVAWSPFAEIVERFSKKGGQVCVIGKLATRSWEDQTGAKRYTTEVIVRELTLLGSNTSNRPPAPSESDDPTQDRSQDPDWLIEDDTDDLPF